MVCHLFVMFSLSPTSCGLPHIELDRCSKDVAALVAGPDMPDATRSIEGGCRWRHQHIAAQWTGGYRNAESGSGRAGGCGVDRHGNPPKIPADPGLDHVLYP
jgi:hypothetical protein